MHVILPASYLPNIAYFSKLLSSEEAIISTGEIFPKQTLRNRCVIMNANGLQNLTVPVERTAGDTATKNIRISYAEDWQKNHLRSIESAYRKTPYYEYYFDAIEKIILQKQAYLIDLNIELLNYLVDKTGLSCKLKQDTTGLAVETAINEMMIPGKSSIVKFNPYIQAFSERHGFQPNLSIIDLLFNEGPNSICVLEEGV
jgi:hypothetical protein